ncbi:hypothetical protein L596_003857 [Steinernema carpocapsae]|uniref:Uncharacterized protein n=1 Tax=Steinernema carpocapsae TaxID=34508 RepID=A0A4U8UTV9_STECR|nr:hypothetical protein L596_003857 [Steinernema carpocapsae]
MTVCGCAMCPPDRRVPCMCLALWPCILFYRRANRPTDSASLLRVGNRRSSNQPSLTSMELLIGRQRSATWIFRSSEANIQGIGTQTVLIILSSLVSATFRLTASVPRLVNSDQRNLVPNVL